MTRHSLLHMLLAEINVCINITVFWDLKPCRLLGRYQCCGWTYCLSFQGKSVVGCIRMCMWSFYDLLLTSALKLEGTGFSKTFVPLYQTVCCYQPLYYPTNALTCINCTVIKNTLKIENCCDMFRFTQEPSSGSKCQYLAKITDMVRRCLSIRTWSVLWRYMPP